MFCDIVKLMFTFLFEIKLEVLILQRVPEGQDHLVSLSNTSVRRSLKEVDNILHLKSMSH